MNDFIDAVIRNQANIIGAIGGLIFGVIVILALEKFPAWYAKFKKRKDC